MPKAVLFTFPGSVWASVPQLAIRELGYAANDIENRVIDLLQGENFAPSFLDINPSGTLPTLVVDGQTYTSTTEVTSYLVKQARKPAKPGTSFIAKIHQDKYDPNFILFLARSDQELQQKAATFVVDFLRNRQNSLERNAAQPNAIEYKALYDSKLADNGSLLSIYQGTASDHNKQTFFQHSMTHWDHIKQFISEELAITLPNTTFFGGDSPSEDDFHLAAWLARVAFIVGGGKEQDSVLALENGLGTKLHSKISAYLDAWSCRKSWKEVYAQGLH